MFLKETSLNWAIKHVQKEGDTDLFPKPFEFKIIKKHWQSIVKELKKIEINNYAWNGPRRLMVPKSEFAFRPVCQLDPLDSLLFAAVIKEIGPKIEKKRSTPTEQKVFSYRFQPAANGQLYAAKTGWESFWKRSSSHSGRHSHVLMTDLADYYNQIYHHTIENQLDLCGVGKDYWYAIKNLLANLTEGVSRGVPIGPHPSHIVAEMAMIPVDHFLDSLGVVWCRYVDDIHIFCESKDQSHAILYKLVDYLDKTQKMQINKQKTKVLKADIFKELCESNALDHPINPLELEMLKTVRTYTSNPYERIQTRRLTKADAAKLSQQNIENVLNQYLDAADVDYVRLRWFIRRLTQIGVPGGIALIVKRFDEFLPAMSEVGNYFEAAAPNFDESWKDVGSDLMKAYKTGVVQASEYLQVVILSLFSRIRDLDHINSLTQLYDASSVMCKRKIMLAAATAKAAAWLSTLKSAYKNADPWNRRAIIYSLRALPADEKKFWLKSVNKRVSGLDQLIANEVS